MSEQSDTALKRLSASLIGMFQTRLELAALELTSAKQKATQTVAFGFLLVLVLSLASVFVCLLVVAYFWDTHRLLSLAGCASFYALLGLGLWCKLRKLLNDITPLFEETSAELLKDKDAIVRSISK